jgi:hypothetical protein
MIMNERQRVRELLAVISKETSESQNGDRIRNARDDLEQWFATTEPARAVSTLLELWDDPNVEIQCQAINELLVHDKVADSDGVLDRALSTLNSEFYGIRGVIVYRLLTHVRHDERVIEPMIRLLHVEPDPDIRYHAISVLGQSRSPLAIPTLQWTKEHDQATNYEGTRLSDHADEAIREIRMSK